MNHLLALYLTKPSLSQNSTGWLPLGSAQRKVSAQTLPLATQSIVFCFLGKMNNDDKESVLWKNTYIVVGDEPRVKQAVVNISLQALMK